MSARRVLLLGCATLLTTWNPAFGADRVGPLKVGGIGVLGDSYSDEYQFYPPDRSRARNWVEILARSRGLDFGPFSADDRGLPRRQGYAYNWARSDATTVDMIAEGQHAGLAEQVARGDVGLVVVFIGGNDLIHALQSPDPAGALVGLVPRMTANLRVALDTILGASPEVRVVLATVPDICHLPEFRRAIEDGDLSTELVDAYSAALRTYNSGIKGLAFAPSRILRIALLDLDLTARLADALAPDHIMVGGRKIDRLIPSNAPDHFFLADERHSGTVGQALMAKLTLEAIKAKFGADLASIAEPEMLEFAAMLDKGDDLAESAPPRLLFGGGR